MSRADSGSYRVAPPLDRASPPCADCHKSKLDYRFRESCHKQGIHLSFQAPMCAGGIEDEGLKAMAAWRRAIELSLGDADVEGLRSIAQSRTEPASRVERARVLLA